MGRVLEAPWRLALALLIAVSSVLLFSTGAHLPPSVEGSDESFFTEVQHDVPVLSRQHDVTDHQARRDDPAPEALIAPPSDISFAVTLALVAWPLPPPGVAPYSRPPGSAYPRGPPARRC